jgi:hypothetical protein
MVLPVKGNSSVAPGFAVSKAFWVNDSRRNDIHAVAGSSLLSRPAWPFQL